jgi:hypothetical protein
MQKSEFLPAFADILYLERERFCFFETESPGSKKFAVNEYNILIPKDFFTFQNR